MLKMYNLRCSKCRTFEERLVEYDSEKHEIREPPVCNTCGMLLEISPIHPLGRHLSWGTWNDQNRVG